MKKRKRGYRKYSPEFKMSVILDMRESGLSCHEAVRKHWGVSTRAETDSYRKTVRQWERRYLEEGAAGLMAGRRQRAAKPEGQDAGREGKEAPAAEGGNGLAAEVRRLRERNEWLEAENAYLKKLDALVRAEEERSGRKPGRSPN